MDEDLDAGLDANDEGDGDKELGEDDEATIDPTELETLKCILNVSTQEQASLVRPLWGCAMPLGELYRYC